MSDHEHPETLARAGFRSRPAAAPAPPCPLCSGTRSQVLQRITVRHLAIGGTYRLRRCLDCDLVYISPRLDDRTLATLYGEEFYFPKDSMFSGIATGVQDLIQDARRQVVIREGAHEIPASQSPPRRQLARRG